MAVYNVAVIVEDVVVSAVKDNGDAVSVMDATVVGVVDDPILTVVACVTPPDSQAITAVPDIVPAISDTTISPGLNELCDATVMVCELFEK